MASKSKQAKSRKEFKSDFRRHKRKNNNNAKTSANIGHSGAESTRKLSIRRVSNIRTNQWENYSKNSFAALNGSEDLIPAGQDLRVCEGYGNNEERLRLLTIQSLDRQIYHYNLTKYAGCNRNAFFHTQPGFNIKVPVTLSREKTLSKLPQSVYIPPHRRNSGKPLQEIISNEASTEEDFLIISNQISEESWQECSEVGIFAYWNGPSKELPNVTEWFEEFCGDQVSISQHSDRLIYVLCKNTDIKTELLKNPDCFFNGFVIKFFDWLPNCCEENLDFRIPIWFSINPLPPELKDIRIIKKIGKSLGKLIGMDNSFDRSNHIKLLIECDLKKTELRPLKVITNRSIYKIETKRYEGGITEIIKLDDDREDDFEMRHNSSDLTEVYPYIFHNRVMDYEARNYYKKKVSENSNQEILEKRVQKASAPKNKDEENLGTEFGAVDLQTGNSYRLQSIIVDDKKHKRKHDKRKRKKKEPKQKENSEDRSLVNDVPKSLEPEVTSNEQMLDNDKAKSHLRFTSPVKSSLKTDFSKKLTKFWKTPSPRKEILEKNRNEIVEEINSVNDSIEFFQNFLNRDIPDSEERNYDELDKIDMEKIENLTEELIQVFDFNNIDNTSLAQKEELVKKVLQLGGKEYTKEDLRRDILALEGNNTFRSDTVYPEEYSKQYLEGEEFSKQQRVSEFIMQEVIDEEGNDQGWCQADTDINVSFGKEQLGLARNQEGFKYPNFGQKKSKRGRKSLKELRELDGKAREQQKINQIFNAGKGKGLPREE